MEAAVPTNKELKDLKDRALKAEVKAALAEAHAAAEVAAAKHAKTLRVSSEGLVIDDFGGADVVAHSLSRRLRKALESLDEIHDGAGRGAWMISNFPRKVPQAAGQSSSTYAHACDAACSVLHRHFPEDAKFYAHRYGDSRLKPPKVGSAQPT
jgi:hypothetical protein